MATEMDDKDIDSPSKALRMKQKLKLRINTVGDFVYYRLYIVYGL